ncbi:MAG: hypothetical protein UX38_C0032G0009 [Microgenomates group bacterium GW2011_GWC1_46_16]|nr:MAG: hypothetical protein UX38_C0032G0009 [Microgenomates group bacterium GW2011_GWC1_46_16]
MPCKINPIRKALLKKGLLDPKKTIKQALLDAGYAQSTAENSSTVSSVRICQAEIERDIKKQITVESVLKSIQNIKSLAIADKDFSTAVRCDELCGRWLAMWRDRLEIVPVEATDGQFSVGRLARMRAIPVEGVNITALTVNKQC